MYEVHLASSLYVTFVCVEQCGTMWNMLFMLPSSCHASHQLEDSNVSHLQSYSSVFSSRLFFSPTKRALRILAEIFRLMFFQTEWNGKNMETSNHLEDQQVILKKNGMILKFCLRDFERWAMLPLSWGSSVWRTGSKTNWRHVCWRIFPGKTSENLFLLPQCCLGPARANPPQNFAARAR